MTTLKDFETIVLDMNETFMFGGDRFSLSQNYFETYQELGGQQLTPVQVSRSINGAFSTLNAIYEDVSRVDNFPQVGEVLNELPETKLLSSFEKQLLDDVFTIHELGDIPADYVAALGKLARTHRLYLISNIWSPKERFCRLLKERGVYGHFHSLVFSSDSRSVKPSASLFRDLTGTIDLDRALFVGDSLRRDIGFAARIGMKSVWLTHGRELPQGKQKNEARNPDFVADDLLCLVDQKCLQEFENCQSESKCDLNPIRTKSSDSSKVKIQSERLRIRETEFRDLEFVLRAENEADNAPYIVNWSRQKHEDSLANCDIEHLVIERRDTSERVGYLILRGLGVERGPVELKRIVTTDKCKGYGLASLNLLKDYVFQTLQRQRLWLNVLTDNQRAKRVYFRAGFNYEGTWKDAYLTDVGYADLELLSALASDSDSDKIFRLNSDEFRLTRILSGEHFQQLYEMYDKQWPSATRTHGDLERAILGSELVTGLIKQSTNELVGFCRIISDRGFRAWIHGVLIREDLRGQGLGRRIMDYLLGSQQLIGLHHVSLSCASDKESFYNQWGFGRVEDEIVMNLNLRNANNPATPVPNDQPCKRENS